MNEPIYRFTETRKKSETYGERNLYVSVDTVEHCAFTDPRGRLNVWLVKYHTLPDDANGFLVKQAVTEIDQQ